jgi:hypothetical protein
MSKRQINNDRVATKADADAGNVIFYIPDQRSAPYSFGQDLPLYARVVKPDESDGFPPPGTILRIVQAEIVDGKDVVLGFVNGDDEGICMLEDLEILGKKPEEQVGGWRIDKDEGVVKRKNPGGA